MRSILDSCVNRNFEAGDKGVAAFETESLLSIELLRHESTKVVRPLETVVKVKFLLVSHPVVLNALEVNTNPVANHSIGNVLEFNTDFATVCCFVSVNNIT